MPRFALPADVRGIPRPTDPARAASLTLFALGAALALCMALSSLGILGVLLVTAVLTWVAAVATTPHRGRAARTGAWLVLIGIHAGWCAMLVALAAVLAWSVPASSWAAVALLSVLVVYTHVRRTRVRVPVTLPLGLLLATLAYGWMREDGLVRCDDYLRVRAMGLEVVIPSTPELANCAPGEAFVVARYPRLLWEDPRGDRMLVSTQRGDHRFSPPVPVGRLVPEWFDGAICEVMLSGGAPRCFAHGKADAFVASPVHDQIYATAHDSSRTIIYALSRSAPLRILAQRELPLVAGILYLDERSATVGLCEDRGTQIHRLRAADLSDAGTVAAPFTSTFVRYDQERGEGVACGSGQTSDDRFSAAAFRADPFSFRPLAPASRHLPSWLAVTWGCDWDPVGRRTYVAVASLGLLQVVDYDSGDVVNWRFTGPGIRPVVFDPVRRRIYLGTFLSGEVMALDADTLAVVDRWFVGRFLRHLELSLDRQSLLATSTLGVVRVPLSPPAPPAADTRSARQP